jgi:IS30 family transposase
LTWDQGKEMALHAQVAGTLAMPVFFFQKASPWQRPSNENTVSLEMPPGCRVGRLVSAA